MPLNDRLTANAFKRALQAGAPQIGLWHSLASAYVAEVTAGSGADWILLDGEHSPLTIDRTLALLQAVAAHRAAPVVRTLGHDALELKQLLDIGAMNLLIPNVQSAEEARRCVAAVHYPPRGIRGVASGVVRASQFGRIADYMQRIGEELCVVVQVETARGLADLEAIAGVDGIDGIFFGPADLAADMGHPGQPGHPDVMSRIEDGIRLVRRCGKAAGVLAIDDGQLSRYAAAGAGMLAVGLDVHLLARATEAAVRRFRSMTGACDASPAQIQETRQ
jgi:4-hydroxy-2-oxoheptanedioate aldolase